MIEIDPGHYIDLNMVEGAMQEGSVFFICMISGVKHMVSPSVYARVIETKKNIDGVKTEQTF